MINSTPVLAYDRRRNRLDPGTTALERRLQDLAGYAEQNGLRIVQLIIDDNFTSAVQRSVRQDPGWRKITAALRAGEHNGQSIQGLLVSHLDRLTRDDRDMLELRDALAVHDLPLYTYDGVSRARDGEAFRKALTAALRREQ
jgi:DNA invertase Pin-like site-specific DNA recombinase